jgi:hypothetical protein
VPDAARELIEQGIFAAIKASAFRTGNSRIIPLYSKRHGGEY